MTELNVTFELMKQKKRTFLRSYNQRKSREDCMVLEHGEVTGQHIGFRRQELSAPKWRARQRVLGAPPWQIKGLD